MAATGLVNVKATTKIAAGAELTKEYLAMELEKAGRPLAPGERHNNGDIKLKKTELVDLLVGIKGGHVFERLVDPEGGAGGPAWDGLGSTARPDVSSAAMCVATSSSSSEAATAMAAVDSSSPTTPTAGSGAQDPPPPPPAPSPPPPPRAPTRTSTRAARQAAVQGGWTSVVVDDLGEGDLVGDNPGGSGGR